MRWTLHRVENHELGHLVHVLKLISYDDHVAGRWQERRHERVFDLAVEGSDARAFVVCCRLPNGRLGLSIQVRGESLESIIFHELIRNPNPLDPGFKQFTEACGRMGLEGQHNDLLLAVLIELVTVEQIRR